MIEVPGNVSPHLSPKIHRSRRGSMASFHDISDRHMPLPVRVSQRRFSFGVSASDFSSPEHLPVPVPVSVPEEHPITFRELSGILKILFEATIPTILSHLTDFLTGLISLGFVGKYGNDQELAGATMGNTWANVFCLGILFSINQGFAVIASQLFGAGKLKDAGIVYQKTLVILGILLVPLVFTLVVAENFLLAAGLDAQISMNTGLYLRCIIPSLIALGIFDCTKFFLISQEHFVFQGILQAIMVFVHCGWCYFFVVHLGMPVAGAALAKSATDVTSCLIILLYVHFSGVLKGSWIPWTRTCFNRLGEYFKHTVVIGANLYVEWITYEISVFICSMLNNEHILGAHGIAITLTMVTFMFPLGANTAMQAYLGNSVGEGNKVKTQKYMLAGLILNGIFTVINVMVLFFLNKQLADIFTQTPETEAILQNIIYIYAIAHLADTNVNNLSTVLRTMGRETEVLICFIVCYVGINLGGQYIFGVWLRYGYIAFWVSFTASVYVMLVLMMVKVCSMDWDHEIKAVKEKMESPEYQELLYEEDSSKEQSLLEV